MRRISVLGIPFCQPEGWHQVLELLRKGGLFVFPSAPLLADDLLRNEAYRQAVEAADYVFPDSGFMTLVWNILGEPKMTRCSGLKFLKAALSDRAVLKAENSFWIWSSEANQNCSLTWLKQNGFPSLRLENGWIAPDYRSRLIGGSRIDEWSLIPLLEQKRPHYIIVNVGGGVQEPLGMFLRKNLSYHPAIICTGAALSFLTGEQARIPAWADQVFLGWTFRIIRNPRRFTGRYFRALKLALLIWKFRDQAVPKSF